jgi:succinyl-diaminopimelate desuccinylase
MSDVLERAASVNIDVVQLAEELIKRPSLTPDDAGCQALITEQLRPFNFAIEQIDFNDVRNLWARRGETAPLLIFVGHTDVVPPGPTSDWVSMPFSPTLRNGCLYGRGAADMKGGVAAFIAALTQFLSEHPLHRGSVGVLLTSDEEGKGTDGIRRVANEYLIERHKVDYCLVGEPISQEWAGDTIKNGARGVLIGRLTIEGIEGHVAYPQMASNPIHSFAPVLAELCSTEWDKGNTWFPATSFQVTNVRSGGGPDSSIPGKLEASLNFRFNPESSVEALQAAVEQTLAKHRTQHSLEWLTHGLPFLTESGRLLDAARNAVTETTGRPTNVSTMGGTSDGRHFAGTGAQIIELGLVSKSIHKANECVRIEDLQTLTTIYKRILEQLLLD